MNTTLIGTETIDLLSRLTGQKLSQRDITPQLVFLATLVTILSGVIYVDGKVTEEEKQRLQKTLNQFVPVSNDLHQLTQLIMTGVGQQEIYTNPEEIIPLMASLSKAQRLLIIGFGYEMSAADGDMDIAERKYLQVAANRLGINPKHLAVLEASFSNQEHIKPDLAEVQSLLDTARFHHLDTLFIKAASELVAMLPNEVEPKATQQHFSAYQQLNDFQEHRQQLDNLCFQVYNIIKDCADSEFLPNNLVKEIEAVSKKLQSQRFRVAVIGEFSQGKSTLLNALLGQEIQPVRAVPCSGTVTVFRYGEEKRIVCHYKDGRKEEILFEEYKEKAAISKQAAIDSRIEELEHSEVEEIIFESPDFELCTSGVELLDSPGLNEHPQRTAITQKLLKETDAAIFLTNATHLLPEKERELLQDITVLLNGGQKNKPAENLFVLVNFMDLLDNEEDISDIKQRLANFINGENQLVKGENRSHYISAKTALKSILNGISNEHLQAFQNFTNYLEQFLIFERGKLKINQATTKVNELINSTLDGLEQSVEILDGNIKISETERQQIIEKIGEASGRDVKIRMLGKETIEQTIQEAEESWDKWQEGIKARLIQRSQNWKPLNDPFSSQKDLIKHYSNWFTIDLVNEIDAWGNQKLGHSILRRNIKILNTKIELELEALKAPFQNIEQQVKTDLHDQINFSVNDINDDFAGTGGLGLGSALAAGLLAFTPLGLIAIGTPSIAAVVGVFFGLGILDRVIIKVKVLELGFQNFETSKDKISEKLYEIVKSAINNKVHSASQVIEQVIFRYENLLQQQNKAHQETLEQRNAEKAWIAQKCEELRQLQTETEKKYT